MAVRSKPTAHRIFFDRRLTFLAVFVQRFLVAATLCPEGFLLPDCSQTCPTGFYGLNCSSLCSGTCADSSCIPSTGHCLKCRPGFEGPTCSKRCPNGRFGQDCQGACPEHCANETCSPFTGFCLECLDGFRGHKCDFAPLFDDADDDDDEGDEDGTENSDEANQILVVSLMILTLLIMPACVAFVCVPRLKRKLRKRKMRLRQKRIFMMQSSGTSLGGSASHKTSLDLSRVEDDLSSVSKMSGRTSFGSRFRQSYKNFIHFADKRRDIWGKKQQRSIYVPNRPQRRKRRSVSLDSIASIEFDDPRKARDTLLLDYPLESKEPKNPFCAFSNSKKSAIILSTTPQQPPKRFKCSLRRDESSTTDVSDFVSPKAFPQGLGNEPFLFDHRNLYFKTVPRDKIVEPSIRHFKGGLGNEQEDNKILKETVERATSDVAGVESVNSGNVVERTDAGGDGRSVKTRGQHLDITRELDHPEDIEAQPSSVNASHSSLDELSSRASQSWAKVDPGVPALAYTGSCTFAVSMDESALSPYQATTQPVYHRGVRSPYAILTNVHSIMSFGKMMKAVMTYFQKSMRVERERRCAAIESNALSVTHRGECSHQLRELVLDTRFESGTPSKDDTAFASKVTRFLRRKDGSCRYDEPIHRCTSQPCVTRSGYCPLSRNREHHNGALRTGELSRSGEGQIQAYRCFEDFEPSSCRSHPERSCPDEHSRYARRGEMYEVCTEGARIESPIFTKLVHESYSTLPFQHHSRDIFSSYDGQANNKRAYSDFGTDGHARTDLTDIADKSTYPLRVRKQEFNNHSERQTSEEEGPEIASTDSLSDIKSCHTFPLSPKRNKACLYQAGKLSFSMAEDSVHFTDSSPFTNVPLTEADHQPQDKGNWDAPSSPYSMDALHESADILSVNCNQPILTRTGSDSFKVVREGNAPHFKDRFPGMREDNTIPPWDMPCNQRPPVLLGISEKAPNHSTIPPINVGPTSYKSSHRKNASVIGIISPDEGDSEQLCSEILGQMSSMALLQPPIHYSARPADVSATDIFLGSSATKPNETYSTASVKNLKYEGTMNAKKIVRGRSNPELTKREQFLEDNYAIDRIQTNASNHQAIGGAFRNYPATEKTRRNVAPSKTSKEKAKMKRSRRQSSSDIQIQSLGSHAESLHKDRHTAKAATTSYSHGAQASRVRSIPKNIPKGKMINDVESSDQCSNESGKQKTNITKQTKVNVSLVNKNFPNDFKTSYKKSVCKDIASNRSQCDDYNNATQTGGDDLKPVTKTTSKESTTNDNVGTLKQGRNGSSSCAISKSKDIRHSAIWKETTDDSKDNTVNTTESEQVLSEDSEIVNDILTAEEGRGDSGCIQVSPIILNESPIVKSKKASNTSLKDSNSASSYEACGDTLETQRKPVAARNDEEDPGKGEGAAHPLDSVLPLPYSYPTPSLLETWTSRVSLQSVHSDEEIMPHISTFFNYSQGQGERTCKMTDENCHMMPPPADDVDTPMKEDRTNRQECDTSLDTWGKTDYGQTEGDDSESDQYQDALSMSFVERRHGNMVGSDHETERMSKHWNSKTSVTSIARTNSTESIYDTINTLSQGEENETESVQHDCMEFEGRGIEMKVGCELMSGASRFEDNETGIRKKEGGSSFGFASCERKTYTIDGRTRSHTLQHASREYSGTGADSQTRKNGHLPRATTGTPQEVKGKVNGLDSAVRGRVAYTEKHVQHPDGKMGRFRVSESKGTPGVNGSSSATPRTEVTKKQSHDRNWDEVDSFHTDNVSRQGQHGLHHVSRERFGRKRHMGSESDFFYDEINDRKPRGHKFQIARESLEARRVSRRTSKSAPGERRTYQNNILSNNTKHSQDNSSCDAREIKKCSVISRSHVTSSRNRDGTRHRSSGRGKYHESLRSLNNNEDEIHTDSHLSGNDLFYDANDQ